jgi:hypothetical protein
MLALHIMFIYITLACVTVLLTFEIIHLHLVPGSGMMKPYLHSPYTFMIWHLIKPLDNITPPPRFFFYFFNFF